MALDRQYQQPPTLHQLSKDEDVLTFLQSFEPENSIPPYEDQNNRRPPKDQTLWLSPAAMNTHYGD